MKHFAIGDGHKLVTCPDRYVADFESDDTMMIWDPDFPAIVIRVTVFSIEPRDPADNDAAFWSVIDAAREKGIEPSAKDNRSYFHERELSDVTDSIVHVHQVGWGNHNFLFTLAVSAEAEKTAEFREAQDDLISMIESLKIREEDEFFTADLLVSDHEHIAESVGDVLGDAPIDGAMEEMERKFSVAKKEEDIELAAQLGIVMGEVIRNQIPDFGWARTIDEYGIDRSLGLKGTSITLFPESSVIKRVESKDEIEMAELMEGILDAVEDMYREHHSE